MKASGTTLTDNELLTEIGNGTQRPIAVSTAVGEETFEFTNVLEVNATSTGIQILVNGLLPENPWCDHDDDDLCEHDEDDVELGEDAADLLREFVKGQISPRKLHTRAKELGL